MADKKKPNSADERPQESDRQYLGTDVKVDYSDRKSKMSSIPGRLYLDDIILTYPLKLLHRMSPNFTGKRSNIGNMMRDVLAKVISNRPEDPIAFLADYFDSMEDQSNLVLKARHLIEMTHHSRPVFDSNIRMAYDLLQKQKVGKKLQGLTGAAYNDLIKTLCRDIPQPVTQKLLRKIECLEYESITYDVFRSSVFTCCVLQDYVSLAASLFQALDFQKTGKVDKALCDAVQDQLKVALGGSRLDARRIVEAGYNLGPDGLFYALERAMRRGGHHHGVQTLEQFTSELCDAFLSRVTSTFKRDYEVISTVLVFFEQIRWDEEAYNDNILGSVISDVINKFAESLCNIKTFLSQSNVTISSNMDRWSVMLPKYRVMNRVGRTDRDYVLVKQADALIGRLIFKYTAMKNILF
ncbi:hypothetical protein FSP39_023912 [Pinctada imbricata]|uniref:Tubulin polyglutamylase complex subunit 1-like C-terminal domain-containing protein n=1 Tax=Pinctada imbricata TaxID=66713 RepID=A0AA89BZC9_PINIB|nr:hypothetical protein FSP39_023912 [Pinctada imbricata]